MIKSNTKDILGFKIIFNHVKAFVALKLANFQEMLRVHAVQSSLNKLFAPFYFQTKGDCLIPDVGDGNIVMMVRACFKVTLIVGTILLTLIKSAKEIIECEVLYVAEGV